MATIIQQLFTKYRRLFVYCMIGCTGAGLDFIVYAFLTNFVGLHYQLANFLSVSFGITNNFVLNRQFNFKTKDKLFVRFCSFYAVGMFGWALGAFCLWMFIEKFGVNAHVAKLCTIFLITVIQFSFNKFITFRKECVSQISTTKSSYHCFSADDLLQCR